MPGNQGIPDRYNAEKILRDIRFVRLKLLDNDQSALCAALFPLQVAVEKEVEILREIYSDCVANAILDQYASPHLRTWMGIQ